MHVQYLTKKILFLFFFSLIFIFIVVGIIVYAITLQDTENQLKVLAKRVNEDITLKNGTWNTTRYNADPELPGTYPLYIFGSDGFVIDRWKPIHGFLDTSDAKRLFSYQTPQTINTDTHQNWRVFSQAILSGGEKVGVLTVAFFNPQTDKLTLIDQQLQNSAQFILSKIVVDHGIIHTQNLDPRDVTYTISFQIVDQYNKIIAKSNNTNSIDQIPNFVDTSYVGDMLHATGVSKVTDAVTGETFLVYSQPIYDTFHAVSGVVVVGRSITFLDTTLRTYWITSAVLILLTLLLAWYFLSKWTKAYEQSITKVKQQKDIKHISFDKKNGILSIDSHEIPIPYATNQFYLLSALFSSPKKRFEADELLEKFGHVDSTKVRKVYDAMILINRKIAEHANTKLVVIKDKTYQLNPILISTIGDSHKI